MNGSTLNIVQTEELELQLHKARQGQLNFKTLAFEVFESGVMTDSQFKVLDACARASTDIQDCLTLNHMTVALNKVA